MNKEFHTNAFRGMLVFLLVLTLNACGAQPQAEVVPAAQPTIAMEPTVIPSPIPSSSAEAQNSTDVPVDIPSYFSRGTKPDVPPQTINGVTVTIDQVYADESHVVVHYIISGLDWPDYVVMDPTIMPSLSSKAMRIMSGAAGWSTSTVKDGVITGQIDQMLTADAVDAAQTPIVDLQVDIPVDGTGAELIAAPPPGQSPQPVLMELPNIGTFHFDFEILVSEGIQLVDINQTVEANDVAMTLESLTLNPSHVDALLCFEMPSAKDWGPDARFSLSGEPNMANLTGYGSSLFLGDGKDFSLSNPERCVGMGTDVTYDGAPTIVTITVPKLLTSVPESWSLTEESMKNANQKLADKGIVVAYNNDPHNPFVVMQRPDGATDMDIYPLIWDALADWYEGPWEFTVEIKP
jgi:hypothetical protein